MRSLLLVSAAAWCLALAGCASGPVGIPSGSKLVAEGPRPFEFVTPAEGRVYLRDKPGGIMSELEVKRGQRVVVEPDKGRFSVDGKSVTETEPVPGASYELYFKEKEKREYHPAMAP